MPIEQDILEGISGIGKSVLDIIYGILGVIPQIFGTFDPIAKGISSAMNISQYSDSIKILLFGIVSVVVFILSGSVRGRARSGIFLVVILALLTVAVYLFL